MDLPSRKFEKWTIETAQMKHTARKSSMASVVDTALRKKAAEYGIADYREFLKSAEKRYEELTEEEREFCDFSNSTGSWAGLCGCVKPYISLDEWLSFSDKTIEGIGAAAMELNPHWFEVPNQEKKQT